jgi:pimeloyl-ACP methyl ester carboxylesterase
MRMLLPGLATERVDTARLTTSVLSVRGRTGAPVLFVHGNVSSALFWQETMLALPPGLRPLAADLRGFGDSDPLPVDAMRGVRDYADDVVALLDALGLETVHLVGWSLGGGVAMQVLRDRPERLRSLVLVSPASPYGFGGTKGEDGTLCSPDGAGSGGGAANPDFVQRIAAGDRSDDSPLSPRQVLRAYYVRPPFAFPPDVEERYLDSMLSTRVGDQHYPGDMTTSDSWPGIAPGRSGVLNAIAPIHLRLDDLHTVEPKPPILWIRGDSDQIVSDTSMFDLGHLGALGAVPDWPGEDAFPAQPMVAQTRAVLGRYAAAGGAADEVVIADCGHSPHVERPAEFLAALGTVLD